MKKIKQITVRLIITLIFASAIHTVSLANIKPAKIFSSNMVLQMGIENTIWGWADPNEKVSVSINGNYVRTKADQKGKWALKIPAMKYGGPYTLIIAGKNKIEMTNVMVGEVWICSGQSNMEWPVRNVQNAESEISKANYPNIRLFTVPKKISQHPEADMNIGEWTACTPELVVDFSAVGYFFGRKIHQDLNVAVGLINSSWGGTVAETWVSSETIKKDPDFSGMWENLQKIDLENYETTMKARVNELLGELPARDNGIDLNYQSDKFDDTAWKTVHAPQNWEEQGYPGFDGVAWFRKSVSLSKEQASSKMALSLAKIDDDDICWINGIKIGSTSGFNVDRRYIVPENLLHEGKNTIAIRVTDTGGSGGIYGNADDFYLESNNNSKISLSGDWKIRFTEINASNAVINPNVYPTLLYNGMINPIVPYGIKGVIWYQGESNSSRSKQYQHLFPSLISDWRTHWQLGDFAFIWVQLANYMAPVEQPSASEWAQLREAQTMTLNLKNTGMASAIDIGDAADIHPRNKQEVGKRLALNALKISYGKDLVNGGPTFQEVKTDGSKILVTFKNTGSGLWIKNKYGYINGFAVAGNDKKFKWANAIQLNDNTIIVSSEEIQAPVAVRYGWADNPDDLNLYNKEGLPANPFRTDNW